MTNGSLMIKGEGNVMIVFRTRDHRHKLLEDSRMVLLGYTSDLEDSGHNDWIWFVILESWKMVQVRVPVGHGSGWWRRRTARSTGDRRPVSGTGGWCADLSTSGRGAFTLA
jgi:hypothetical protein